MEQFKVGDRVISTNFGVGRVEIITTYGTYPVEVKFSDHTIWYTKEGRRFSGGEIDLFPINSNQTNMDELKITKQRVLDAAARCGTAKATLETLFPEAFQSANCIPLEKQVFKSINGDGILTTPCWREGYENLIALNDRYDYKLTMGPRGLSQYLRVTPK